MVGLREIGHLLLGAGGAGLRRGLWLAVCAGLLAGCSLDTLATRQPGTLADAQAESDRSLYLSSIAGLIDTDRPQAALAFLEDYQNRWPQDPRALTLQGRALLSVGDVSGARQSYENALESAQTAEALIGLGRVAALEQDWVVAQTRFAEALELEPANARALNNYGYALLKLGLAEDAYPWLERASELDPNNVQIAVNVMVAAWFSSRREEAERIIASFELPSERARAASLLNEWSPRFRAAGGDTGQKDRVQL